MAGLTLASPTADTVPLGSGSRAPYVSPARETWRRFRRHRLAVLGLAVLALMMLAVVLGPLVWRVPINDIDFSAQLIGPSWAHPLGTDDLGQDVLARMLYGGRLSLPGGGGLACGAAPLRPRTPGRPRLSLPARRTGRRGGCSPFSLPSPPPRA